MNGTIFLAFACAASMIVSTAQAQNIYADLVTGMAKQGMAEAEKLLEAAPGMLDETLKRGDSGEQFETAQYCRGALQSAVNLGAALSNIMPFSKVWTLEDERGPVGRFRIMLNGEQIHADVYCEDNFLRSVQRPWGPGSSDPDAVQVTAFSALAGAALNLKLQGAFDNQEVEAAAGPNADDSKVTDAAPTAAANTNPPQNADTSADIPFAVAAKVALATKIQSCWNVGSLSAEALQVSVKVSVNLAENGVPETESITMVSYNGTNEAAAAQAFEAARRAIIRCGVDGFELPPDEYEEWEKITLEFDSERMRVQ
jgi:hypothetical protein